MHIALLALGLAGCSDYSFAGPSAEPEPGEEPGVPSIFVDPYLVDAGVVCGTHETVVTVDNRGSAPLEITSIHADGGWSVLPPTLPLELAPGEAIPVAVEGTGSGNLTIESDDPEDPLLVVPLDAAGNAPPSVTLLSPGPGQVLPSETTSVFSVSASDDGDPAEDLDISWVSDVDGLLATAGVAPDGTASLVWDPAVQSWGAHAISAVVTDTCGATAEVAADVCQQFGYEADNLALETWNFEGVSRYDNKNGYVELTAPDQYVVGSAFQTAATVKASNVSIEFKFWMGSGSGADGFTVTALDADRMTSFLGGLGGGMGSAGLPGWTIEVDTYHNSSVDPTEDDHLAFTFDGTLGANEAWAALPEMEDTGWHTMVVEVAAPHVTVSIDGVTYIDQDIEGYFDFPAWVGFTAATGDSTNYHLIDALLVTNLACD